MSDKKLHHNVEMKGWLMKWTNCIKGYQRRWFVLSNGRLSYYKNQAEMAHTCRGTISLHGALIHTVDSHTFVISNGGMQTFHIKATNEMERQRWVTALELAKTNAIRAMESEDEEDVEFDKAHKREMENAFKVLNSRLEVLQTCNELISEHCSALQHSLSEIESLDNAQDVAIKMKGINERATLFRFSSNAMINACSEFIELAQTQGHQWKNILQHEKDQRKRLEEIIEQLARHQNVLEQAALVKSHQLNASFSASSDEDGGVEFYGAECDQKYSSQSALKGKGGERTSKSQGGALSEEASHSDLEEQPDSRTIEKQGKNEPTNKSKEKKSKMKLVPSRTSKHRDESEAGPSGYSQVDDGGGTVARPGQRRTRVPDRPNSSLNLWSIMKNCIGKELTKIPMPVNFSEPLSMLQRLTEDFEYAGVLDAAAGCADPSEQLAFVAAFTVSSYSSTAHRAGKPFNPLLGETYECDRRQDLGWRAISEQVSHHPPMVAQHCEGKHWISWQEFTMNARFRGKYLQVVPMGTAHCVFHESGNHYTWRKVTTTVHNIIVGKLWVDQHGEMEIENHKDGSRCKLVYTPYSYFTRNAQRKVKGCVYDGSGTARWLVNGTWDDHIDIAPVTSVKGNPENPIYKTGLYKTAWKITDPPPDCDKYYNLTLLACQLNEPEEGVAPTDSRLRPDQRLMEEGRWPEANATKLLLEEKQRKAHRQRHSSAEQAASEGVPFAPYEPLWFRQEMDPTMGQLAHAYKGGYWECKEKQDWSQCPDLF